MSLGALTPSIEFVNAAVETDADAILVSSLYGQGELDCRGFRDICIEAGIGGILIYVGVNVGCGQTGLARSGAAISGPGVDFWDPVRRPRRSNPTFRWDSPIWPSRFCTDVCPNSHATATGWPAAVRPVDFG